MKHNPGFVALVNEARAQIQQCTVADVKGRMDRGEGFQLIDVREDREYAAGRIPGARHIGRGVLERDVESVFPDRDVELVLYCGGGYRSALAALNLQKMGYRRVVSMDGGIRGWREAGYPEDLSPAPAPGV
jgi:rhodanese-related sulfurtransferase